ncbi:MAG: hypothetical protein PHW00_06060 [Clostridia bacterium]|nr:hypothetical protein [Clostridia bacterium]
MQENNVFINDNLYRENDYGIRNINSIVDNKTVKETIIIKPNVVPTTPRNVPRRSNRISVAKLSSFVAVTTAVVGTVAIVGAIQAPAVSINDLTYEYMSDTEMACSMEISNIVVDEDNTNPIFIMSAEDDNGQVYITQLYNEHEGEYLDTNQDTQQPTTSTVDLNGTYYGNLWELSPSTQYDLSIYMIPSAPLYAEYSVGNAYYDEQQLTTLLSDQAYCAQLLHQDTFTTLDEEPLISDFKFLSISEMDMCCSFDVQNVPVDEQSSHALFILKGQDSLDNVHYAQAYLETSSYPDQPPTQPTESFDINGTYYCNLWDLNYATNYNISIYMIPVVPTYIEEQLVEYDADFNEILQNLVSDQQFSAQLMYTDNFTTFGQLPMGVEHAVERDIEHTQIMLWLDDNELLQEGAVIFAPILDDNSWSSVEYVQFVMNDDGCLVADTSSLDSYLGYYIGNIYVVYGLDTQQPTQEQMSLCLENMYDYSATNCAVFYLYTTVINIDAVDPTVQPIRLNTTDTHSEYTVQIDNAVQNSDSNPLIISQFSYGQTRYYNLMYLDETMTHTAISKYYYGYTEGLMAGTQYNWTIYLISNAPVSEEYSQQQLETLTIDSQYEATILYSQQLTTSAQLPTVDSVSVNRDVTTTTISAQLSSYDCLQQGAIVVATVCSKQTWLEVASGICQFIDNQLVFTTTQLDAYTEYYVMFSVVIRPTDNTALTQQQWEMYCNGEGADYGVHYYETTTDILPLNPPTVSYATLTPTITSIDVLMTLDSTSIVSEYSQFVACVYTNVDGTNVFTYIPMSYDSQSRTIHARVGGLISGNEYFYNVYYLAHPPTELTQQTMAEYCGQGTVHSSQLVAQYKSYMIKSDGGTSVVTDMLYNYELIPMQGDGYMLSMYTTGDNNNVIYVAKISDGTTVTYVQIGGLGEYGALISNTDMPMGYYYKITLCTLIASGYTSDSEIDITVLNSLIQECDLVEEYTIDFATIDGTMTTSPTLSTSFSLYNMSFLPQDYFFIASVHKWDETVVNIRYQYVDGVFETASTAEDGLNTSTIMYVEIYLVYDSTTDLTSEQSQLDYYISTANETDYLDRQCVQIQELFDNLLR